MDDMKVEIRCPICHKLIAKKAEDGKMIKVSLWCRNCKKEIYVDDDKNKEVE